MFWIIRVRITYVQLLTQDQLNFVVVRARQGFQFFRQIAWFLESNRDLSKFRYRLLYNLFSITKLWKNHSIKANFNLTTRATLNCGYLFCLTCKTLKITRRNRERREKEKRKTKPCLIVKKNFVRDHLFMTSSKNLKFGPPILPLSITIQFLPEPPPTLDVHNWHLIPSENSWNFPQKL